MKELTGHPEGHARACAELAEALDRGVDALLHAPHTSESRPADHVARAGNDELGLLLETAATLMKPPGGAAVDWTAPPVSRGFTNFLAAIREWPAWSGLRDAPRAQRRRDHHAEPQRATEPPLAGQDKARRQGRNAG